ncbi:hypothetical protein Micbo1qcDRAFT_218997 [Microdochium bolleyi]|uniref:Uncharacterized protein n=1 Tax=Microdochium bolleyi TaxID=196109 RepID=A0A136IPF3_9PEZI|nr:hypothetical protein Micbo1qcDRAFT_218997 [Microdochium bolleyi]
MRRSPTPVAGPALLNLDCLLAAHLPTVAAAPSLTRDQLIAQQPYPILQRSDSSSSSISSVAVAVADDEQETWAIRNMSRVCSADDKLCEWTFIIDTGAPLPGDPEPAATYTARTAATVDDDGGGAEHHSPTERDAGGTVGDASSPAPATSATSSSSTTQLTTCTHLVPSMSDGTPASRATSTVVTRCGAFGVTSGWTRVAGDGSSTTGLEATTVADQDAGVLAPPSDGFTVLSVVDYARGVLVYPAYSDVEILAALEDGGDDAAAGGEGVVAVRRYRVEKIP